MITIERANTIASKWCMVGWLLGLAYYSWFSSVPVRTSLLAQAGLVVVGLFFSSVIIGGCLALLAGVITKLCTGSVAGSPHAFAWAAFIGPVLSFLAARPAVSIVAGLEASLF